MPSVRVRRNTGASLRSVGGLGSTGRSVSGRSIPQVNNGPSNLDPFNTNAGASGRVAGHGVDEDGESAGAGTGIGQPVVNDGRREGSSQSNANDLYPLGPPVDLTQKAENEPGTPSLTRPPRRVSLQVGSSEDIPRRRAATVATGRARARSRTITAILGEETTLESTLELDEGEGDANGRPSTDSYQARARAATIAAKARGIDINQTSGSASVDLAQPKSRSSSETPKNRSRSKSLVSNVLPGARSRSASAANQQEDGAEDADEEDEHHHDSVVEHLDVIDPTIGTVSTLQNCANMAIFPTIPGFSRKPVITLPELADEDDAASEGPRVRRRTRGTSLSVPPRPPATPLATHLEEDESSMEDELDKHVKDVLSKRQVAKRVLKGVWTFVKTPMGFITAVYFFLVAFWGAAIVLFLLGWIKTGSDYNKKLWIGIAVIWWYKRKSKRLRKQRGLPPIEDPDDLPDPLLDPDYVPVLTEKQMTRLRRNQEKFMKSQTWYRPHATETHRAFNITWALAICWLIVWNSIFQVMLCCTMWTLNRYNRPAWTTGTLIPASFLCMIVSSILIWKGGQKTKKTAEVESKLRDALGVTSDDDSETDESKKERGSTSSAELNTASTPRLGSRRNSRAQAPRKMSIRRPSKSQNENVYELADRNGPTDATDKAISNRAVNGFIATEEKPLVVEDRVENVKQ